MYIELYLTENSADSKNQAVRVSFFPVPQVLGSDREFHFVHRMVPHARVRRSISHTRKLKSDPLVSGDYSLIFSLLNLLNLR